LVCLLGSFAGQLALRPRQPGTPVATSVFEIDDAAMSCAALACGGSGSGLAVGTQDAVIIVSA
jgi:hypothetical protein